MAKSKKYDDGLETQEDARIKELMGMTVEELNSEFLKAKKNEIASKKQKKDHSELNALKDKIKEYRATNETKEMKDMKEALKIAKQELDSEIQEDIEDKKALESGFQSQIKSFVKEQKIILKIIRDRENY